MIVRFVRVEKSHFVRGIPADGELCAIGLAMCDAGFDTVWVDYRDQDGIAVKKGRKLWSGSYPVKGAGTEPFSFWFVGKRAR